MSTVRSNIFVTFTSGCQIQVGQIKILFFDLLNNKERQRNETCRDKSLACVHSLHTFSLFIRHFQFVQEVCFKIDDIPIYPSDSSVMAG